jgi:hypothetical protein
MTPCGPLGSNGLHGVISQKMIFFITTAVKTSNPTQVLAYAEHEGARKR